jgi:hypothetical protein
MWTSCTAAKPPTDIMVQIVQRCAFPACATAFPASSAGHIAAEDDAFLQMLFMIARTCECAVGLEECAVCADHLVVIRAVAQLLSLFHVIHH